MEQKIYSMRKKLVNEKRDVLKQIPQNELVDKILEYPNQRIMNFDEEGNKRHFPIGKMAQEIRKNDYKMSNKQYYALLHQFTAITVPSMKVVGVSFKDSDPSTFDMKPVAKRGSMTRYDLDYIFQPEPENPYDKNAVRVMVKTKDGTLQQLGYVPADFVAAHPITEEMSVHGQMTDWSNGKFKNCSYDIAFDIEKLDEKASLDKIADDIIENELPFPITTMKIEDSLVEGTEKIKVSVRKDNELLMQKTYYEGKDFITYENDNVTKPDRIDLLSGIIHNYNVDKLDFSKEETTQEILISENDLSFVNDLSDSFAK